MKEVPPTSLALPTIYKQYHAAAGDAADRLEGDGRALAGACRAAVLIMCIILNSKGPVLLRQQRPGGRAEKDREKQAQRAGWVLKPCRW